MNIGFYRMLNMPLRKLAYVFPIHNVVNYINRLSDLNHTYTTEINLPGDDVLYIYTLISLICLYFLKIFSFMFISDNSISFSLCTIIVQCWYITRFKFYFTSIPT